MMIDNFLIYLGYAFLFFNLILYNVSFFRKGKANVFFVCYLIFSFVMQFSMEMLYRLKITNLLLVNVFFIGQFILLGFFFKSLFIVKNQKRYLLWSLLSGLLLIIIESIYNYNLFFEFNLFEIILTSLLLVSYAVMHLYNQLTAEKVYYYITIGVIIYMLSSTVLFLVGNLTNDLSDEFKYLSWQLNAFLFIVLQLFYLYEWKVSFYKKSVINV